NTDFLTEAEQQHVQTRRVGVRQLRQISDAHQHLRGGVAAAHFEITTQRGRETETDRLKDRIDPERHAPAVQLLHGLAETLQGCWFVWQSDNLTTPIAGGLDVRAVDAEHKLRSGPNGGLDLDRVETVNGNAHPLVP